MDKKSVALYPLIGFPIEVVKSSCREFEGVKGKTVDEKKNIIVIEHNGKEKRIPKNSCVFRVEYAKGEKVDIKGKGIMHRPEEKIKNVKLGDVYL